MFCPYCGKTNEADNAFCQYCGKTLPVKPIPQPTTVAGPTAQVGVLPAPGTACCPGCGQPYQLPFPPYCLHCGYPLNSSAQVEKPIVVPRNGRLLKNIRMPKAMELFLAPRLGSIQKSLRKRPVQLILLAGVIILTAGLIWVRSQQSRHPTWITSEGPCQPVTPDSNMEAANIHDLAGQLKRDSYFQAGESYNISENETFTVPRNVTLIIEPGALVRFGSGARMVVEGELQACGKSNRRILFTADAKTGRPGYWQGIELVNADSSSAIGHATFEFAGMNQHPVIFVSGVRPHLEDLIFDSNQYYSLSVTPDGYPLVRLPFTVENGPEGWEIRDGNIDKDLTWDAVQPLVINGVMTVGEKATLTVAQGMQLKFLPNAQIQVYGKVRAIGSSAEHIRITAASELLEPGMAGGDQPWSGLTLRGKRSTAELNYVDYRYESSEDQK